MESEIQKKIAAGPGLEWLKTNKLVPKDQTYRNAAWELYVTTGNWTDALVREKLGKPPVKDLKVVSEPKVEIMPAEEVKPVSPELVEFTKPVPTNKADALQLISSNLLSALKYSALRYWNVGRVMDVLEKRKEKNVIEDLIKITKFEERALRYMLAVYRTFPEIETVYQLSETGMEWSHLKQLTTVKDSDKREKLVTGLIDGSIPVTELPATLEAEKPPKEPKKKPDDGDKYKPSSVVKFFNKSLAFYQGLLKEQGEISGDLFGYAELIDDETKVSDAEVERILEAAKETQRTIESLTTMLNDYKIRLDQKVLIHETNTSVTKGGKSE